jgi:hypothetical protein
MRRVLPLLLCVPFAVAEDKSPSVVAEDPSPSAFRFGTDPRVKITIDRKEIRRGHPTAKVLKDLIPAIWKPEAIPAAEATWLEADDRVLGLAIQGEARAYPLRILEAHEMVNDVLGGQPVAPNY